MQTQVIQGRHDRSPGTFFDETAPPELEALSLVSVKRGLLKSRISQNLVASRVHSPFAESRIDAAMRIQPLQCKSSAYPRMVRWRQSSKEAAAAMAAIGKSVATYEVAIGATVADKATANTPSPSALERELTTAGLPLHEAVSITLGGDCLRDELILLPACEIPANEREYRMLAASDESWRAAGAADIARFDIRGRLLLPRVKPVRISASIPAHVNINDNDHETHDESGMLLKASAIFDRDARPALPSEMELPLYPYFLTDNAVMKRILAAAQAASGLALNISFPFLALLPETLSRITGFTAEKPGLSAATVEHLYSRAADGAPLRPFLLPTRLLAARFEVEYALVFPSTAANVDSNASSPTVACIPFSLLRATWPKSGASAITVALAHAHSVSLSDLAAPNAVLRLLNSHVALAVFIVAPAAVSGAAPSRLCIGRAQIPLLPIPTLRERDTVSSASAAAREKSDNCVLLRRSGRVGLFFDPTPQAPMTAAAAAKHFASAECSYTLGSDLRARIDRIAALRDAVESPSPSLAEELLMPTSVPLRTGEIDVCLELAVVGELKAQDQSEPLAQKLPHQPWTSGLTSETMRCLSPTNLEPPTASTLPAAHSVRLPSTLAVAEAPPVSAAVTLFLKERASELGYGGNEAVTALSLGSGAVLAYISQLLANQPTTEAAVSAAFEVVSASAAAAADIQSAATFLQPPPLSDSPAAPQLAALKTVQSMVVPEEGTRLESLPAWLLQPTAEPAIPILPPPESTIIDALLSSTPDAEIGQAFDRAIVDASQSATYRGDSEAPIANLAATCHVLASLGLPLPIDESKSDGEVEVGCAALLPMPLECAAASLSHKERPPKSLLQIETTFFAEAVSAPSNNIDFSVTEGVAEDVPVARAGNYSDAISAVPVLALESSPSPSTAPSVTTAAVVSESSVQILNVSVTASSVAEAAAAAASTALATLTGDEKSLQYVPHLAPLVACCSKKLTARLLELVAATPQSREDSWRMEALAPVLLTASEMTVAPELQCDDARLSSLLALLGGISLQTSLTAAAQPAVLVPLFQHLPEQLDAQDLATASGVSLGNVTCGPIDTRARAVASLLM